MGARAIFILHGRQQQQQQKQWRQGFGDSRSSGVSLDACQRMLCHCTPGGAAAATADSPDVAVLCSAHMLLMHPSNSIQCNAHISAAAGTRDSHTVQNTELETRAALLPLFPANSQQTASHHLPHQQHGHLLGVCQQGLQHVTALHLGCTTDASSEY